MKVRSDNHLDILGIYSTIDFFVVSFSASSAESTLARDAGLVFASISRCIPALLTRWAARVLPSAQGSLDPRGVVDRFAWRTESFDEEHAGVLLASDVGDFQDEIQ